MASMNLYQHYIEEIDQRKDQGLNPKPIDGGELLTEIIENIKGLGNEHRNDGCVLFDVRKK